jgi:hypothetical protein
MVIPYDCVPVDFQKEYSVITFLFLVLFDSCLSIEVLSVKEMPLQKSLARVICGIVNTFKTVFDVFSELRKQFTGS